ncbi:beta-N-acetylhexosaminidase [Agromyces flavus]|uniref:Beta-N-acetylhexosaminidase n=1 Tax=Agromyces flavus TaxID=589382 RepID=A0A1H1LZA1_9MICO|nr:glycoside hydrolase family 3 N-terminal domain-containing protein [Agromyces flavus]MCP2368673.1 beta-N-acetylhexosaminidase [Agromyces flavus]GGI48087.1 sugar hydrolase [Agromyces flavus]SDR79552.1 beta-N-acetylhexosaminidase [Agromyces flavus]
MSTEIRGGAGDGLRRDILTTLLPGFEGPDAPAWLVELLGQGLGGVCLFGTNVQSPAQLAGLTRRLREANPDAVVAIDEEGGDVTRLFADRGAPYPGNAVLGRIDDVALTRSIGRAVGEALAAVGCTMTFAPDADINSNPSNPVIGVRSFGASPEPVAHHTAAWVEGVQSAGIDASAKHFPGHGDTATDSHLALPVVDLPLEQLRERELAPFRAAIAAGTRSIMTSHILLPQLDAEQPATLSPRILQRLLRGELGFEGVIVSDALDMAGASGAHGIPEAAVRALVAGCDLLCIGTGNTAPQLEEIVAAIADAVASGRLAVERVADAAARVRSLASRHPAPSETPSPQIVPGELPMDLGAWIAASFDVADGVLDRLAGAGRIGTIVRVDTAANIAVGDVPWGPFALRSEVDSDRARTMPAWLADAEVVALDATTPIRDAGALEGPVLVVGKDLHRHAFAVAAIARLRETRAADVVTVDMGWPSDDRAFADISTFGASRAVAEAFVVMVERALAASGSAPASAPMSAPVEAP